jgi:2-dehydro-3-deoxyphosphooctonate aldolase (KDO 8-P synthase)
MILIAGPCVIESEKTTIEIAEYLVETCNKLKIDLVFKGSYRKANRTDGDSFTGIGDIKALEILHKIGSEFNIPVLTDIHSVHEAEITAGYVDILQIPAFLCRQTDIIDAAAKTGKTINIKKGQFATWETMLHAVRKVKEYNNVIITERGNFYGYDDLVIDYRNIPLMKKITTVIVDITHSQGAYSGSPEMIYTAGKCAIASGADGVFLECHPDPSTAKCDGDSMLKLELVKPLLEILKRYDSINSGKV